MRGPGRGAPARLARTVTKLDPEEKQLPPWARLPSWLVKVRGLSPIHLRVLLVIGARKNRNTGQCNAGVGSIAKNSGDDPRDVRQALKDLTDCGVIIRHEGRRPDGSHTSSQIDWPDRAPAELDLTPRLRGSRLRGKRRGLRDADHPYLARGERQPLPSGCQVENPGTPTTRRVRDADHPPNRSEQGFREHSDYVTGRASQDDAHPSHDEIRRYVVKLAVANANRTSEPASQRDIAELFNAVISGEMKLTFDLEHDLETLACG